MPELGSRPRTCFWRSTTKGITWVSGIHTTQCVSDILMIASMSIWMQRWNENGKNLYKKHTSICFPPKNSEAASLYCVFGDTEICVKRFDPIHPAIILLWSNTKSAIACIDQGATKLSLPWSLCIKTSLKIAFGWILVISSGCGRVGSKLI